MLPTLCPGDQAVKQVSVLQVHAEDFVILLRLSRAEKSVQF